MIVSIMDAENHLDEAAAITALIAGISAVANSKKTLALQYTESDIRSDAHSILNILSGKEIKENEIRDVYAYNDDGLDALIIRAETSDLTKDHYDECVAKLLEKENMLDVIRETAKPNLYELTSDEALRNILLNAKEVYDYVFVMIPADKEKRRKLVTELSDADIVIVPQGKNVGDIDISNGKTNLLIKEYEPDSRFDMGYMRKKYRMKKFYTIPHNVGFRDAVITESLLDFILKNRKDIKSDDNYPLTCSLNELISRYMLDDMATEEDEEQTMLRDKDEKIPFHGEQPTVLPESAVQEINVRRGFFGRKKKTHIMIDLSNEKGGDKT